MTYYYKMGEIPHKRHTQFRQPNGCLYHEEVMGIHGFAGIQSILYHVRPPTAVRQVEVVERVEIPYEEGGRYGRAICGRLPFRPAGMRLAAVSL